MHGIPPFGLKKGSRSSQNVMVWIHFCREWYLCHAPYIDGLVQSCSISSTLAMELLQSCTKPLICNQHLHLQWRKTSVCFDWKTKKKLNVNLHGIFHDCYVSCGCLDKLDCGHLGKHANDHPWGPMTSSEGFIVRTSEEQSVKQNWKWLFSKIAYWSPRDQWVKSSKNQYHKSFNQSDSLV